MNKGIVMEMNGNELIVMTREGSFERVPKGSRSCQVGEEIVFSVPAKKLRKIPFSMPSSFAAAAVVCLIVIGGLSGIGRHPVIAYVSMDINPSVEMGIDSSEHVRELRGLNSDGTQLIDHFEYKGKTLNEVTGALIDKAADVGYFSQGITTDIVIASTVVKPSAVVSQGETTIADEVKSRVAEQLTSKHEDQAAAVEVTAIATPVEVREQARNNGLSAGKYAIYLAASNNGHDIPLQAFKEDSIRDIASKNGGLDNLIKSGKPSTAEEWKKLVKDDKDGALSEKAKKLAESPGHDNGNGKDDDNGPGKGGNGKANNGKGNDDGKNSSSNNGNGNSNGKGNTANNSKNGNSGNNVGKSGNGNNNGNSNGKSGNGNNNGQNGGNAKGTTSSNPGNTGKGTSGGNGNTGSAGNNGKGTTDNGKGNNNNGKSDNKNNGNNDGKLPPVKLPAVTGSNGGQSGANTNSNGNNSNDDKKKTDDKKQDDGKGNSNDNSKSGDKPTSPNNGKQANDGKDKPSDNKNSNPAANKSGEANKQDDKKSSEDSKQQDKDKKNGNDKVGNNDVPSASPPNDNKLASDNQDRNVFSGAFSRFEDFFKHRRGG